MFDLESQKKNHGNYVQYLDNNQPNEVYGNRTSSKSSSTNSRGSFHAENRLNFVKKVYSILTVQLVITVLFSIIAMSSKQFLLFQLNNIGLLYVCIITTIIIMLVLVCATSAAKVVPWNYVLLFAFTICESYIVSFFCGVSQGKIVFMAAIATLGIVCALTFYAMTTKTDFTLQGGLLFILGMGIFLICMFNMFFQSDFLSTLIAAISSVLFGLYLIYDTQLIMGGKNAELSLDDYILGALMLYSDIIGLFIELLNLFNRLNSEQ